MAKSKKAKAKSKKKGAKKAKKAKKKTKNKITDKKNYKAQNIKFLYKFIQNKSIQMAD